MKDSIIINSNRVLNIIQPNKSSPVSMNAPENDWTHCQSPEGTQDAQVKEKQTSTRQT